MGFGLLLIGYFTATLMALHSLGGIFKAIGYSVVAFASKKLAQYNRSFFILLWTSVVMALFSGVCAINDLSTFLYNNLLISAHVFPTYAATALTTARVFLDLAFTVVLCLCVNGIARETGATKIVYTSVRNLVFYGIFFAVQMVIWLATWIESAALANFIISTMLPVWMVILNILSTVLIAIMIFSCYAKICDASDVEMRQKPSRFDFINKRRAMQEQRREKLIAEAEAYTEEQRARSAAAQKSKKKKHK